MIEDYLHAAKDRIAEIDGEHQIAWIDCMARIAIADALVDIAESLRKIAEGEES